MTDIDITDGIAVKLLVAGIVLTSGTVGSLGLSAGSPIATEDGGAQDIGLQLAFPIDNVTADGETDGRLLAFPIDNITIRGTAPDVQFAFPIDNVTAIEASTGSPAALTSVAQDIEPYSLPQDMDPY